MHGPHRHLLSFRNPGSWGCRNCLRRPRRLPSEVNATLVRTTPPPPPPPPPRLLNLYPGLKEGHHCRAREHRSRALGPRLTMNISPPPVRFRCLKGRQQPRCVPPAPVNLQHSVVQGGSTVALRHLSSRCAHLHRKEGRGGHRRRRVQEGVRVKLSFTMKTVRMC